ncbi:MAG: hypothetical protein LBE33_05220 [Zoogloeaceae bacterium]|jgi:Na+/glutamate symporter|nr:hypothetical protein [Zoogloeaceae bacterium]
MLYLVTIGLIFAVLIGGILVDRGYRRFARHNPQLGPFRPEGRQDCTSCVAGSGCDGSAAAAACATNQKK